MITDAVMGMMFWADACIRANKDLRSEFKMRINELRVLPNDGSYRGSFDDMVRDAEQKFRIHKQDTKVGLWVNEVAAMMTNKLPAVAENIKQEVTNVIHVKFGR